MAVLGTKNPTLLDAAKSLDPDGSTADVVELLNQTNEILLDMPWFEGNLPTGHRTTVRTGLPTAVWRRLYGGVPASKSTRAQVDEACGMLEARNEIDVKVANLNGNSAAFRLSEAVAFLEAMNENMASTVFYGDTTVNAERFNGLAVRYGAISGAPNADNIIDCGGTGSNNCSIWMVTWGDQTAHGIFPKGSKAGIAHQDLGEIDAFDANNNRFRALADRWEWNCGVALKDWRYVVRAANINVNDLRGTATPTFPGVNGTSPVSLPDLLIEMMSRIPKQGMGRTVIYANRQISKMLRRQAMNKSQNALSITQAQGQIATDFLGIPIRTVDALLNTEARVV
ncbi:major capsid protein [Paraburkholderia atlantica]|uniref:major capsid protein n=1 Tax=Paraburkholderia atlantica TaxID=2654982 RepID=UPI003D25D908